MEDEVKKAKAKFFCWRIWDIADTERMFLKTGYDLTWLRIL